MLFTGSFLYSVLCLILSLAYWFIDMFEFSSSVSRLFWIDIMVLLADVLYDNLRWKVLSVSWNEWLVAFWRSIFSYFGTSFTISSALTKLLFIWYFRPVFNAEPVLECLLAPVSIWNYFKWEHQWTLFVSCFDSTVNLFRRALIILESKWKLVLKQTQGITECLLSQCKSLPPFHFRS